MRLRHFKLTNRSLGVISMVAVTITSGFQLAFAPIASAAGAHLCEVGGFGYCLYTVSFDRLSGIVQRDDNKRDIEWSGLGGTFHNHPTGELKFSAHTSSCVGLGSFGTAVKNCTGDTYTTWARYTSSGAYIYINVKTTKDKNDGHDWVLSCDDIYNDAATVKHRGATGGWHQTWVFSLN